MIVPLTEPQLEELKKVLKRCSPKTLEAAIQIRNHQNLEALPSFIYGVIERFMLAAYKRDLSSAPDDTRLKEDLGLDSFTLLEIVLTVEECLGIHIENQELKEVNSLSSLKKMLNEKISGVSASKTVKKFNREQIALLMPQQPPFLFLDDVILNEDVLYATYKIRGDENFLEGHFKGNPVVPASIIIEALGQLACFWIIQREPENSTPSLNSNESSLTGLEGVRIEHQAKPGDTLEMEQRLIQMNSGQVFFECTVKIQGERIVRVDRLSLKFNSTLPAPSSSSDANRKNNISNSPVSK
jgi:3-hydroxymyristoyl/3-hydroxydecanoyl-(acyl carrier protein) dehydratase/acyl carrier protein